MRIPKLFVVVTVSLVLKQALSGLRRDASRLEVALAGLRALRSGSEARFGAAARCWVAVGALGLGLGWLSELSARSLGWLTPRLCPGQPEKVGFSRC